LHGGGRDPNDRIGKSSFAVFPAVLLLPPECSFAVKGDKGVAQGSGVRLRCCIVDSDFLRNFHFDRKGISYITTEVVVVITPLVGENESQLAIGDHLKLLLDPVSIPVGLQLDKGIEDPFAVSVPNFDKISDHSLPASDTHIVIQIGRIARSGRTGLGPEAQGDAAIEHVFADG